MSLISVILGLLCVVVVSSVCPHVNFLAKHICTYCPNINSVNNAAVQAAAWRQSHNRPFTHVNSIFVTGSMTYHKEYKKQKHWCVFDSRAPKYNCQWNGTHWGCRYRKSVIAYHLEANGHYEKSMDR